MVGHARVTVTATAYGGMHASVKESKKDSFYKQLSENPSLLIHVLANLLFTLAAVYKSTVVYN